MRIYLVIIMVVIGIASSDRVTAQQPSVSFQVFYDELSPYGSWIETPDYGYAWVPNVQGEFAPYSTNGDWVYTDAGWTWVSKYPWGWAPFHYGRWYDSPRHGYMWIPDTEWSPGWVTWRDSDDYYGWAPMGPGVTISITLGSGYYVPDNYWRFVRRRNFGRGGGHRHYVHISQNQSLIRSSRIMNNARFDDRRHVKYNPGPNRQDVERNIGRSIAPIPMYDGLKPGENVRNNRLEIYRPDVQKNAVNGQKTAPARVSNGNDIQRNARRPAEAPKLRETPRQAQPKPTPQPPKMLPTPKPNRMPRVPQPSQPQPSQPQPSQPQPRREPRTPLPSPPRAVPQPSRPQPRVVPQPSRPQPRVVPQPGRSQPREQSNRNNAPQKRTPSPKKVQGKYN